MTTPPKIHHPSNPTEVLAPNVDQIRCKFEGPIRYAFVPPVFFWRMFFA